MRRFNILTLMMGATIAVTACSAKDDAILGSRDDIIIMNNGVPVERSKVASAEMAAPAAPEMIAAPAAEVAADVATDAMADVEMTSAEGAAAVTAATNDNISEIDAEVAAAAEAVAKAERELAAAQNLTEVTPVVTEAQNIDAALVKEALETTANEAVASIEQPVEAVTEITMSGSDAMNSAASSAETQVAAPVAAPQEMAAEPAMAEAQTGKVEGACYKQMLIPAVIDASGKVTTLPKVEERRIICPSKMNDGIVAVVQKALMSKGYNVQKADGKFGSATSAALEAYQRDNGLGIGGFTYETMKSLGL